MSEVGLVKVTPDSIVYAAQTGYVASQEQRHCNCCGNTSMVCSDPLDVLEEHWRCTICGNEKL